MDDQNTEYEEYEDMRRCTTNSLRFWISIG